jgi:hypothetical protein
LRRYHHIINLLIAYVIGSSLKLLLFLRALDQTQPDQLLSPLDQPVLGPTWLVKGLFHGVERPRFETFDFSSEGYFLLFSSIHYHRGLRG